MENGSSTTTTLHIAMLPWLAMGHLNPFLDLAKRFARLGHTISFLTTPANIKRLLPKIPPTLSHLIRFVEIRMPTDTPLPVGVENTIDIVSDDMNPYLGIAFNTFQSQFSLFLEQARPDWVINDYSAGWAPSIAAEYGIPCTFLALVSAAILSFFGPPKGIKSRKTMEALTKVPDWITLPTTIAYRPHEARKFLDVFGESDSDSGKDFSKSMGGVDGSLFVAVRSCNEFEQEWIELLSTLYKKPIIPVSLLPPSSRQEESWTDDISKWLDKKELGSVVYVAYGSEAKLKDEQVAEVANGLELSGLPFIWALRVGSPPAGFEERIAGRGMVRRDWVKQDRILGHASVGAFLTHGGWNSIVEGMCFGVAMVLLPLQFDQGVNARYMVEKGLGVEIERDEEDGTFTKDGIAKSLRLMMKEQEGIKYKVKAKECKKKFGVDNEELHDKCVEDCVKFFLDQRMVKL